MIRIAAVKDARRVTEFMKQFEKSSRFVKVNVDYASKRYEDMIAKDIATMLILEDDEGNMQGGLGFIIVPDLHSGAMMGIETYWYVSSEFRGGESIKLLIRFENICKEKGCEYAAMIHMMDSYPAELEKLYRKRGYEDIEHHWVKKL